MFIILLFVAMMSTKLDDVLGELHADLDGLFETIRTRESNLGNLVCDVMVASCNGDCAILNSGTLRSDRIHPAGPFTMRDLMTILPMLDSLVVLNVTGIITCLSASLLPITRLTHSIVLFRIKN